MTIYNNKLTDRELGIVQAVLKDFNENKLPRVLDIKRRVDNGEKINSDDINLLDDLIEMSQGSEKFVEDHPDFAELIVRAADLYHYISSKALEIEKSS